MLEGDAFKAAVELQRETYKTRFFNSPYGDEAGREQAYRMNVALDDLLNSISAFVTQAEAIRSAPADDDDETE